MIVEEIGLILAEDKTRITHVSEGFDFIGFETRQRHTKDETNDSLKLLKTL